MLADLFAVQGELLLQLHLEIGKAAVANGPAEADDRGIAHAHFSAYFQRRHAKHTLLIL